MEIKMNENRSYADSPEEKRVENVLLSNSITVGEVRKNFSVIGFGIALYTAVSLVAVLIIEIIGLSIDPDILENNLFLNLVTPVSLYLFALPILLLVLRLFDVKGESPERKNMSFGAWIAIFFISFGFMYIGSYVGQGVMLGFSTAVGYDYSNALETIIDYDNMWVTAIFICIVAPIGEEFVFRKLIIDRTHKFGGFVSIFFSALIFGLMHANFYQFFYALALGLVLGYVYYSTGNIWYGIGIHSAINFVGSVVTSYLNIGLEEMSEALARLDMGNVDATIEFLKAYWFVILAENAFSILVIVSMILAIILPIKFRYNIILERRSLALPRGKTLGAAFLNVGVIILLAVYIFEFVLNLLPPKVG